MTYFVSDIARIIHASGNILNDAPVSLLLTDSRSLSFPEETLFFALKTKQNDGHKYVTELYQKGVRTFVISQRLPIFEGLTEANLLVVKDTLAALQQLAASHRKHFQIPVIGITGSNGKTIVKEWLYQLLNEDKRIVRSPRSYNSQTGVPLSVWRLDEQAELALFEAGISQPEEMERLEKVIAPEIGILTNIGSAHQEGFQSIEQKCLEKLKLFTHSETIVYEEDDQIVQHCILNTIAGENFLSWSKKNQDAPLYISKIKKGEQSTFIQYNYLQIIDGDFEIPFTEDANIENAIHCLAVMLYFQISPDKIRERMMKLHSVAMRLEVKEGIQNCLIIDDTYNLDFNSLELALDFQMRRAKGSDLKRTLILSDLQQTGKSSHLLYLEVANLLKQKGIDKLIGIGKNIGDQASLFPMGMAFYETTEEFLQSTLINSFDKELILVKGAREFHFEKISDRLQLKVHETILEVNLDAIVHNFNFYRSKLKPTTKMVCMVKAFGYGAGSYELAKTLQEHHCDYLAVAVADEGAELRKAGIYMPLMVMNPEMSSFNVLFDNDLEPEVYSFKLLKALIRAAEMQGISNYPVHIKIDSGMHRLGFLPEEMDELTDLLTAQTALKVRSVFSHLAGSDSESHNDYTLRQIERFTQCAERIESAVGYKVLHHILNTAGIFRFPEHQKDMVRLGIGLYGVSSCGEEGLRNVSTLKTTILQIKDIKAGETIGYGRKWTLTRDSRIGTIPIGYADGLDRHLSNGVGEVVVNGKRAKIVGNICMDITMIDLTDTDAQEGDTAIIFGEELTVQEIADKLGTIPYEIITSIATRVKRIYYRE
ncbi:bifunctional UDP-N-acetylmuramoyl-tripeptide:D-alanyl-D-alanine ligase/alanine racemase [Parabacteroides sp. FAFU027]|uniref:bifunctional UDP-N-acetylmuramoyl-tripeptide:D-alanyl-D-alanine ligase/alanine racemase n=1 Tax=Parabacteroides sp. FAFU027 TaxID=2922715 RepID=UPI001FAF12E9|nr:bifunctional UDP-N-acetylmuramoyl-tripeptide:D-alanyl-D-alanine ligase/alanine racemase [Parabacteroides sp. FAFU027]